MPKPLPSPHLSPKQTLLMLASIAEAAGGQMGVALNKQNVKEYVDDRDYPQIEGDDPERRRRQVAKIIPGAFALYVEIGLLDATGADKEGAYNDATRRWYALWKSDSQSAWQMFRDHLSQSWFAKTLYNRPPGDSDEAYQTLGYAAEFEHEPDEDEQNALQKAVELLIYFDLISPAEAEADAVWDTPTGEPDDTVTSEEAPRERHGEKRNTHELIDGSATGAHDILDADSQQFAVSGWLSDPHNPMGTDAEPPTGEQPAFDGEQGIYTDKTAIGTPETGGYFVDFATPEQVEDAPAGDEFVPQEAPRSTRFGDDEQPATPPAETYSSATEEASGAKTQPTPPKHRSFAAQVSEEDSSESQEAFIPRRRRRSSGDRMLNREGSLDDILADSKPVEEAPHRTAEPVEPAELPPATETAKQAPPTFATRAPAWEDERSRRTPPPVDPTAREPEVDDTTPRRRLTTAKGAPPSDDMPTPRRRPTIGASRPDDDLPIDRARRRQRPQEAENNPPRSRPAAPPPDVDPFDAIRRRRTGGEPSSPQQPSAGPHRRQTNGPVDMRRHGPRSASKKQQDADDAVQYVSDVFGVSITAMPDGEIRLNMSDNQWKKLSEEDRAILEEAMRLVRRAVRNDDDEE